LLLVNAPKPPQLNPIELFFSKIKQAVSPSTEKELVLSLDKAIKSISSSDITGYIRRVLYFCQKALLKEDFD